MKALKKVFIYSLLLLLCLGCRRKDGRIVFSCPGKEQEIYFWHAMGGPLGETLEGLATDFSKEYPKYKIKLVNCGNYTALSQKVLASLAARNTPALAQVFSTQTALMIRSNRIVCLDDLQGVDVLKKSFFPVLIKENSWDGKLWSIPFNKSVQVVYYNAEEFEKKGLKPPEDWQEFLSLIEKLTEKDANGNTTRFGLGMSLSTWTFQNFLSLTGGTLLDDEGNPHFQEEAGVRAFTFLLDMIHKKKIAKVLEGFEVQNEFMAGRIAMVLGSCASYSFMKPVSTFKLGVFKLPKDRKSVTVVSGTNVVLFKGKTTHQTEGAWLFLKWLSEPKQSVRWSMATSYAPVSERCFEEKGYNAYLDSIPGLKDAYLTLKDGDNEPRFDFWVLGRKALSDHLEKCLITGSDPEKELKDAADKIMELKKKEEGEKKEGKGKN